MVANTEIDLARILARLDRIEQLLAAHVGQQQGANTSILPHSNMSAIGQGARTLTNNTARRTLDPTADTLTQIGNALATLITDLQLLGIVG